MILNLRGLSDACERRSLPQGLILGKSIKPLVVPIKSFYNGFQRIELYDSQEIKEYESGYLDGLSKQDVCDNESVNYRLGYLESLCTTSRLS